LSRCIDEGSSLSYSPATETVRASGESQIDRPLNAREPALASERTDTATSPFRPVQFLGAKTRALGSIVDVSRDHLPPESHLLDIFTGSSLVAQSFARVGLRLSATDALYHSVHFARALLGVDRHSESSLAASFTLRTAKGPWERLWAPWVRREDAAIASRDPDALIRLAEVTPQRWRPANASPSLREMLGSLGRRDAGSDGLVAAHYAGTYFGIKQALAIDRIRSAIARARQNEEIGSWVDSVLLTALLSAASECAFSAGKHYAQPHRIRPGKDLSFIRSRILSDRSKDVMSLFRDRVDRVRVAASAAGGGHGVARFTLEEFSHAPDSLGPLDAIYADPPYTAQQYSRFYHVPEVICSYKMPSLQKLGGSVTRGLYPDNRFKSRFCSRRLAGQAFRDLFSLVEHHNAVLLLSYSASRSGKTGNQRSIELPELRALLRSRFGRGVEERELPVTYRQFNSTQVSVSGRADAELLFVARRHA
jgi:adenine-specific DNA methylase